MPEFEIKRATRAQTKLRLAFCGASNAGKTTASLLLAKGIIEAMVARQMLPASLEPRVGLIDTERRRAQLYSHLVPFDTIELDPPYSPERYMAAMRQLETCGYEVIIVDSLSHAWVGDGGVLDMVEKSSGNNSFANWKSGTPAQNKLIDSVMSSRAHMICTMRSKTEWVLEEVRNRDGRMVKQPRRIGMKPIQRAGVEYEFTSVIDLQRQADKTITVGVIKDNTGVLEGMQITGPQSWNGVGESMLAWMLDGAVSAVQPPIFGQHEVAEETAAKFERLAPRITNMPDLQRAYTTAYRELNGCKHALSPAVIEPFMERINKAKDVRKREISAGESAPSRDFTPITPDDVDTIEGLLMIADVSDADFKEYFRVGRIAMLPFEQYDEAITWIIERAGAAGVEVKRPQRVVKADEAAAPTNAALNVVNRLGAEKPSLFNTTT